MHMGCYSDRACEVPPPPPQTAGTTWPTGEAGRGSRLKRRAGVPDVVWSSGCSTHQQSLLLSVPFQPISPSSNIKPHLGYSEMALNYSETNGEVSVGPIRRELETLARRWMLLVVQLGGESGKKTLAPMGT